MTVGLRDNIIEKIISMVFMLLFVDLPLPPSLENF